MSAQLLWIEAVTKKLAQQKAIKSTVDTCPLCWAKSGLPAFVFRGNPNSMCGSCTDIVKQVKIQTN